MTQKYDIQIILKGTGVVALLSVFFLAFSALIHLFLKTALLLNQALLHSMMMGLKMSMKRLGKRGALKTLTVKKGRNWKVSIDRGGK